MTKKNIQCSLASLGRMTALWAQGRRGIDVVMCSGHHGLEEEDDTMDPGMAWVIIIVGSGTVRGA
jgi:hypothetical protein